MTAAPVLQMPARLMMQQHRLESRQQCNVHLRLYHCWCCMGVTLPPAAQSLAIATTVIHACVHVNVYARQCVFKTVPAVCLQALSWSFNPATGSIESWHGWQPAGATQKYKQIVIIGGLSLLGNQVTAVHGHKWCIIRLYWSCHDCAVTAQCAQRQCMIRLITVTYTCCY